MSSKRPTVPLAIEKINQKGILLVFPVNNRSTPRSLWSEFYPKTKLKWEWDDNGDQKVFKMWQLMKELSTNKDVVYSKWHQGRATFFSRDVFQAMLCVLKNSGLQQSKMSASARSLLDELESSSPLSTRDLKKLTGLQGKLLEGEYVRSMKELFSRLLIVGFGEVDDGAFPSLAVGASQLLFEDLWLQSQSMSLIDASAIIEKFLPIGTEFRKCFDRIKSNIEKVSKPRL